MNFATDTSIYKRLLESVTDYVYTVRIEDGQPVSTYHGPGCLSVTGYAPDDYERDPGLWHGMIHPDDKDTVFRHIEAVLEGKSDRSLEHRIIHRDGSIRWIRNTPVPRYDDFVRLIAYDGLVKEITKEKLAETRLRESEAKYRSLIETAGDAILIVDGYGYIKDINNAARLLYGFSREEFLDLHPAELDVVESVEDAALHMEKIFSERGDRFETKHRTKDGRIIDVEISIDFLSPEHNSGCIFVRDITEKKRLAEELAHNAFYDSLTNLPNRALFKDRLIAIFTKKRKRQISANFALLFIDIDHFKKINDSLGHAIGDSLLVEVAGRLKLCIRPGDTASRFGGDEFVIILENIVGTTDARTVAERVHKALSPAFALGDEEVFISASIGIVTMNERYENPEDMLRDADTALYHAKKTGRGDSSIFDQEMYFCALESMRFDNDLHRALEKQEFVLFYQPIIDISTGAVDGLEALIRWRHPSNGLILPMKFIPLAEENGMITAIGKWVLREACTRLAGWQKQFPNLSVSVNLSVKQFTPFLPAMVEEVIRKTGANARNLRLEITESVIMADFELKLKIMNDLKHMKIQIYLDDFGTGYSSLNYIHRFPVSTIKIDQTFVKSMGKNREAGEIVKAIIFLARKLNKSIIVEGVEELSQLEQFRKMNCNFIQGMVFSPPMEAALVERYITDFAVR